MTDRTDHRAAAEGALTDAREWGRQAEEPTPEVGELTCLAYSAVHALLALHDTLTAADRYAANEAKQREEAEPDPLDEDDHRDRMDSEGDLWGRNLGGCWHTCTLRSCPGCGRTLAYLNERYGPLTFAPNTAQEATGDDLSAPEGENGSEERGEAEEAVEPLLCPIAEAVKAERLKLAGELRVLLSTWRDDGVPLAFELLASRWEQALIEQAVEQPRSSK